MRGTANAQQDISSKQDRLTVSSGSVNINGTTIYPPTTAGSSGQVWTSDGSGQGAWRTPDTTVTEGSTNLVTGDAVFQALEDVGGGLTSVSGVYPIKIPLTDSTTYNQKSSGSSYAYWGGYTHGEGTSYSGTIVLSSDGSATFTARNTISVSSAGDIDESGYSSYGHLSYSTTINTVSNTDVSGLIGGKKTGTATISGNLVGVFSTNAVITVSLSNVSITDGKISSNTSATVTYSNSCPHTTSFSGTRVTNDCTAMIVTSLIFTPS